MIKQLIANGKASYTDFGIYIKERNPSMPSKRKNIKTVPGMHGSYDFSNLYGEPIYDDRTIEYKFDITGWDIQDLDTERRKVFDWIMNINNTEIIDEYSPDYHWVGSYSEGSWQEDAEQGLLTVVFLVYPFAISNRPREIEFSVSAGALKNITINNKSSHRISPKVRTDGQIILRSGNSQIGLQAGDWNINNFYLNRGDNLISIGGLSISGTTNVCIYYDEEVF